VDVEKEKSWWPTWILSEYEEACFERKRKRETYVNDEKAGRRLGDRDLFGKRCRREEKHGKGKNEASRELPKPMEGANLLP